MVAQSDGDQAGAMRVRTRRAREIQDAIGGKRTDREIVVSGPAEAAEIRAPADDLDEESRSELRVGSEDLRRWRIHLIRRPDRRFLDDEWRAGAGLRLERGHAAVVGIPHVVEGWNVESAGRREALQKILSIRSGIDRSHQRRD